MEATGYIALAPDEFRVPHQSNYGERSWSAWDLEDAPDDFARNAIDFSSISLDGVHGRPVGAAGHRVDVAKNGASGMKGGI